jgi:hypothetical protein
MVVPGRKGIDILVQEIRACVAYSSSLEEKKERNEKYKNFIICRCRMIRKQQHKIRFEIIVSSAYSQNIYN